MLLRTLPADRVVLAQRMALGPHTVVVALCAQWCTTCREFRAALERVAAARPAVSVVWVDIEDDADLLGDLDLETFPTLAVFVNADLRHFGAVLPQASLVERLIADAATLRARDAPGAIADLVRTLVRV